MLHRTQIVISALLCCALFFGCSSNDEPAGDGGVKTDGPSGDGPQKDAPLPDGPVGEDPITGSATLSFKPTWGANSATQLDANWRPSLPYYEGDSVLVVMLCNKDDATCANPVLLREVASDETDGEPIQKSFGPQVDLKNLPEGDYLVMIFADGTTSRKNGHAWDSGFSTTETAWKGVVSEGDMMLSSKTPTTGDNPDPEPVAVTLSASAPHDMGTVTLSHVHERNISPAVPTEQGTMAVAVEEGLRFVDLSSYDVQEVSQGSGYYTHQLVDASDNPLSGVCGMVKGHGGVAYLLYSGGYAYAYDLSQRKQLSTFPITFAQASSKTPCRGTHVRHNNKDYLFVLNASAGSISPVGEGMWYADVTDIATQAVDAPYLNRTYDWVLNGGFGAVVAHGSDLYLSQLTPATATNVPADCKGKICVFRATFDATGKPDFKPAAGQADALAVMDPKAKYTTAQGDINCLTSGGITTAGLMVAPFTGSGALNGHNLLFVGGCLQIAAYDLDDNKKKLDFNSVLAGSQAMDATVFGQGFSSFELSADGKTLWTLPSYKSVIHFDILVPGPGDPTHRQTFNRYMAMPIDLTAADLPGITAAYATGNIDGHEGPLSLGDYQSPADDPGIDINYAHAVVYQMTWAPSTSGSTFQSASIPVGPTFAVTPKSLWMRGAGASGVSGLGKGGNLAVYDLASRRAVMWSHSGADFYQYWQTGPGGDSEEEFFGFDLSPEGQGVLSTYGLAYLP